MNDSCGLRARFCPSPKKRSDVGWRSIVFDPSNVFLSLFFILLDILVLVWDFLGGAAAAAVKEARVPSTGRVFYASFSVGNILMAVPSRNVDGFDGAPSRYCDGCASRGKSEVNRCICREEV